MTGGKVFKRKGLPCINCESWSCYKKNCEASMKIKAQHADSRQGHVKPTLAATCRNFADEPTVNHPLWALFTTVCEAMDEAAVSDDTCLILGTTRSRTAYSITFKVRGQTATCYGADEVELMAAIEDTYQPG